MCCFLLHIMKSDTDAVSLMTGFIPFVLDDGFSHMALLWWKAAFIFCSYLFIPTVIDALQTCHPVRSCITAGSVHIVRFGNCQESFHTEITLNNLSHLALANHLRWTHFLKNASWICLRACHHIKSADEDNFRQLHRIINILWKRPDNALWGFPFPLVCIRFICM